VGCFITPGVTRAVIHFVQVAVCFQPYFFVHCRPVSRLVRVCGEVPAAPTEVEEISFLCTVCARLKREPHLINFFLRGNVQEAVIAGDNAVKKADVSFTLFTARHSHMFPFQEKHTDSFEPSRLNLPNPLTKFKITLVRISLSFSTRCDETCTF